MTQFSVERTGNTYWQFDPDARDGRGQYRYNWAAILPEAAAIVQSYADTGVTLRQLFYRLVASERLPNTQKSYNALSVRTAQARRDGWFPSFIDNGRDITLPQRWQDAHSAREWLRQRFAVDRTEGQRYQIYLGVEKATLRAQIYSWFGATMGIPVIALGGYASQTLKDDVAIHKARHRDDRESVLIYAGDFDASGVDIPRDFVHHTGPWDHYERIALTPDQIAQYRIPPQPGKVTDSRAKSFALDNYDLFMDVYGMDLVQVELDALDPDDLRAIYTTAVGRFWDDDAYRDAIAREKLEDEKLRTGSIIPDGYVDLPFLPAEHAQELINVLSEHASYDLNMDWVNPVIERFPDEEDE